MVATLLELQNLDIESTLERREQREEDAAKSVAGTSDILRILNELQRQLTSKEAGILDGDGTKEKVSRLRLLHQYSLQKKYRKLIINGTKDRKPKKLLGFQTLDQCLYGSAVIETQILSASIIANCCLSDHVAAELVKKPVIASIKAVARNARNDSLVAEIARIYACMASAKNRHDIPSKLAHMGVLQDCLGMLSSPADEVTINAMRAVNAMAKNEEFIPAILEAGVITVCKHMFEMDNNEANIEALLCLSSVLVTDDARRQSLETYNHVIKLSGHPNGFMRLNAVGVMGQMVAASVVRNDPRTQKVAKLFKIHLGSEDADMVRFCIRGIRNLSFGEETIEAVVQSSIVRDMVKLLENADSVSATLTNLMATFRFMIGHARSKDRAMDFLVRFRVFRALGTYLAALDHNKAELTTEFLDHLFVFVCNACRGNEDCRNRMFLNKAAVFLAKNVLKLEERILEAKMTLAQNTSAKLTVHHGMKAMQILIDSDSEDLALLAFQIEARRVSIRGGLWGVARALVKKYLFEVEIKKARYVLARQAMMLKAKQKGVDVSHEEADQFMVMKATSRLQSWVRGWKVRRAGLPPRAIRLIKEEVALVCEVSPSTRRKVLFNFLLYLHSQVLMSNVEPNTLRAELSILEQIKMEPVKTQDNICRLFDINEWYEEETKHVAAAVIQGFWAISKAKLIARELKIKRFAHHLISKHAHDVLNNLESRVQNARVIQAWWQVRLAVMSRRQAVNSAVVIQSIWRTQQARTELVKRRRQKEMFTIIKLQAVCRRWLAYKTYQDKNTEKMMERVGTIMDITQEIERNLITAVTTVCDQRMLELDKALHRNKQLLEKREKHWTYENDLLHDSIEATDTWLRNVKKVDPTMFKELKKLNRKVLKQQRKRKMDEGEIPRPTPKEVIVRQNAKDMVIVPKDEMRRELLKRDIERSGQLSKNRFIYTLAGLGLDLSSQQIFAIANMEDVEKTGYIDYERFIKHSLAKDSPKFLLLPKYTVKVKPIKGKITPICVARDSDINQWADPEIYKHMVNQRKKEDHFVVPKKDKIPKQFDMDLSAIALHSQTVQEKQIAKQWHFEADKLLAKVKREINKRREFTDWNRVHRLLAESKQILTEVPNVRKQWLWEQSRQEVCREQSKVAVWYLQNAVSAFADEDFVHARTMAEASREHYREAFDGLASTAAEEKLEYALNKVDMIISSIDSREKEDLVHHGLAEPRRQDTQGGGEECAEPAERPRSTMDLRTQSPDVLPARAASTMPTIERVASKRRRDSQTQATSMMSDLLPMVESTHSGELTIESAPRKPAGKRRPSMLAAYQNSLATTWVKHADSTALIQAIDGPKDRPSSVQKCNSAVSAVRGLVRLQSLIRVRTGSIVDRSNSKMTNEVEGDRSLWSLVTALDELESASNKDVPLYNKPPSEMSAGALSDLDDYYD